MNFTRQELVACLSVPGNPGSKECSSLVCHALARMVRDSVVRSLPDAYRHLGSSLRQSGELADLVRWSPEFGLALAQLRSGDSLLAAVQYLVASWRSEFDVEVEFARNRRILANGAIVQLRGATRIRSDGHRWEISSDEERVSFEGVRLLDASENRHAESRVELTEGGPSYLVMSGLSATQGIFPLRPSLLVGAETPSEAEITKEEIARKLSHAMSLIRSEAPASWDWISPVIDGFLITKGSLGRGISSSTFPGLIALTRLGNL